MPSKSIEWHFLDHLNDMFSCLPISACLSSQFRSTNKPPRVHQYGKPQSLCVLVLWASILHDAPVVFVCIEVWRGFVAISLSFSRYVFFVAFYMFNASIRIHIVQTQKIQIVCEMYMCAYFIKKFYAFKVNMPICPSFLNDMSRMCLRYRSCTQWCFLFIDANGGSLSMPECGDGISFPHRHTFIGWNAWYQQNARQMGTGTSKDTSIETRYPQNESSNLVHLLRSKSVPAVLMPSHNVCPKLLC